MTETLDLIIDDLGAQGDGLAHQNGLTYFVEGALPGERVLARPAKREGSFNHAKLVEILMSSKDRTAPPCPHFLSCGGCRLQHLNAAAYSQWKIRELRRTLEKAGLPDAPLQLPAVSPPASRRRARLAARHDKDGVALGFNAWRSHDLVDVKECPVLTTELVSFVHALRDALPSVLPKGKECDIQITGLVQGVDAVFIGGPPPDLEQRQALASVADKLDIAQLSWRKWDRSPIEPVAHRLPLSVAYGARRVPFPPGSFLQATEPGESALLGFAQNALGHLEKIADLFCGLGGFGLSMASAKKVCFADADGPAVSALSGALKSDPPKRVERRNLISSPYEADVLNAFDAVIFDPPRGGAKAQAVQIAQSRVADVVAISCDPPSFARDAKILLQGGYKMKSLLPVDQFLWSTHLELVAHFAR